MDAAYRAIRRIVGIEPELENYAIQAVNESSDAIGEARVTLDLGGVRVNGRGASTDVIEASIKAYIDGINRLFAAQARIAGQEAQAAEEARKAV